MAGLDMAIPVYVKLNGAVSGNKTTMTPEAAASPGTPRTSVFWPGLTLAAFVMLACLVVAFIYGRSLHAPLIFDDFESLSDNPTIRSLNPARIFRPPNNSAMTGRPLVNATFALQYVLHGERVWAYRLVNIALHLGGGLLVLGIVRRTLGRMGGGGPIRNVVLAGIVALAWLAHPLNTEAVIYVTQRTELMVAFFFLLTLYAAIRAWDAPGRIGWALAAIAACCLGMASKEVMVGAPLLIWLYDRTFVGGGFLAALRRSKLLYAGIFASWALLALVVLAGHRDASTGLGHGVSAFDYLLTQGPVILWYLRLSIWPHPLTIAYPIRLVPLAEAWPYAAAVLALLVMAAVLIWKRSPAGFVAALFFVVLAPTSSVLPIMSEIVAERRMYLPLAGLVALVVIGADRLIGRALRRRCGAAGAAPCRGFVAPAVIGLAMVVVLAVAARSRARDYRSSVSIWEDAARKSPTSLTAVQNLGIAYTDAKRYDEALEYFQKARELSRDKDWRIYRSLAILWLRLDKPDKAEQAAKAASLLRPDESEPYSLLGEVAVQRGRYADAALHFREALRRNPGSPKLLNSLGAAIFSDAIGGAMPEFAPAPAATRPNDRVEEAIRCYRQALAIQPDLADAHNNLATALAVEGKLDEARQHFERALQINPAFVDAHLGLGAVLATRGNYVEAIGHFRHAVSLQPHLFTGYLQLGEAYLRVGRTAAAADAFRQAINEEPSNARAHDKYGGAMAVLNQFDEAIPHFEKALELNPNLPWTKQKLELARKLRAQRDAATTQPASRPATLPAE